MHSTQGEAMPVQCRANSHEQLAVLNLMHRVCWSGPFLSLKVWYHLYSPLNRWCTGKWKQLVKLIPWRFFNWEATENFQKSCFLHSEPGLLVGWQGPHERDYPQCSTEYPEDEDLKPSEESREPTLLSGDLKRRLRSSSAGKAAAPTSWQLTQ